MSDQIKPFVILPGEGTPIRGPVGGTSVIKARTETTGGSFALIDNVVDAGQGPPAHTHEREDEMWFVVDGLFRFRADDDLFEAPAGSFVFVPRRTAHCFQNISAQPGRILVMFTPAGMERFFEQRAALPPGDLAPGVFDQIAHDNWMRVVGPPLAKSHPLPPSD